MKIFNTKTGIGFIKDFNGNIICKTSLPIGNHPIKDDYIYVEVENRIDFDKIEIYKEPISIEQLKESKIQKEMRDIAIKSLKDKGEL